MKKVVKLLFSLLLLFIDVNFVYARESIDLSVKVDNVTNKVNNTFSYEIIPLDTNFQGVTGEPSRIDVVLNNVIPDNDNKVKQSVTIDFSKTNYTNAGDYYYRVVELGSSDSLSFPLSNKEYMIVVRVTKKDNIFYKDVLNNVLDTELSKTNLLFSYSAAYSYITIVMPTSNGSRNINEYFKYKIFISGNVGDKFFISGQDEVVYFGGKKINTINYYEVKSGDDNYAYVYIKHGQKIMIGLICPECNGGGINQIPVGTKYSLQNVSASRWQKGANFESNSNYMELTVDAVSDENIVVLESDENYDVAFISFFGDYFPHIFLTFIGVISLIIMFLFRRKSDDDDDDK